MKRTESRTKQDLCLTERFSSAVEYVREIHTENRKDTKVPYMAHLMGTASLVMGENGYLNFPVTENMVIAALLHDVVEDHGGLARLRDVEAKFGHEVAEMVRGCTDSFAETKDAKGPWEERKIAYLERLKDEPSRTQLISAADKLYNARSILDDFRDCGAKVWERFQRSRDQQLWYLEACLAVFTSTGTNRIVEELGRVVSTLRRDSN